MAYSEMRDKRKYEQRLRAESTLATRRRVTEATLELHMAVGPAATRVADIARRAGVQRVTVYKHFATDDELFAACSAHWRALHPAPQLADLEVLDDPRARLREGLRRIYAYYRETEPMTANVLRDMEQLPALRTVLESGLLRYLAGAAELLATPLAAQRRDSEKVALAVKAALDFHFWRALSVLGDDEAAEIATRMVSAV
jgi:AcrR family transcriptional regulator